MPIHPTAIVDSGAHVAPDADIGPFAVVGPDVVIGAGTRIGPHAVVHRYTRLGEQCRVHAHAVLGDLPQDLAFDAGNMSRVVIGDGVTIREGVTVHRGTKLGTETVVGDGCYLMAYSHLAHNCRIGRRVIIANNALLAGYVDVGDGAFISGGVVIHQFTRIGRLAMLSGNAGIGKDIPPFCTAKSCVRNKVAGLNVVGLRRAGMAADVRRQVRRAFELLYRSGLNFRVVPAAIRSEFQEGPALEIADFIEASKRGICSFAGAGRDDEDAE